MTAKQRLVETIFAPLAQYLGGLGISYWWATLAICMVALFFLTRRIRDRSKKKLGSMERLNIIVGTVAVSLLATLSLVVAFLDQLGLLRGGSLYRK